MLIPNYLRYILVYYFALGNLVFWEERVMYSMYKRYFVKMRLSIMQYRKLCFISIYSGTTQVTAHKILLLSCQLNQQKSALILVY